MPYIPQAILFVIHTETCCVDCPSEPYAQGCELVWRCHCSRRGIMDGGWTAQAK